MQHLNFPSYDARTRLLAGRSEIFDLVRRKFVAQTPEEWVRQHLINYLVQYKHVPVGMMGVEKQVLINKIPHRFDLVVFSRQGNPLLLAECKAPGIQITEKVFDQAARYNLQLNASFFMITNGFEHFTCRLDYEHKQYIFIPDLPVYREMIEKA